jgi:hypothetical protein
MNQEEHTYRSGIKNFTQVFRGKELNELFPHLDNPMHGQQEDTATNREHHQGDNGAAARILTISTHAGRGKSKHTKARLPKIQDRGVG